ncbi:MAG: hypothetical protein R2681_08245 [Pyrinomonadaceae bacterium]
MKNTIAKLFTALTTIAALIAFTFAQNADDFLVTKNSVGKVKLGMTVGEAKKIWKDYKFERTSDAEVSTMIAVKKGSEMIMRIYTGEADDSHENPPIKNGERIEYVEIWSKNFQTAEGAHPKMSVRAAENVYGKVKNIIRSELEMREFAEFAKQPAGIDFRLSSKADFAGVSYKRDELGLEVTRQFVPSAYVLYIAIASRRDQTSKTEFTSFYTDLKKDCKTQESDEGGHASTFCKGPGNYRIHYFDSATTLEFIAETTDGENSVRLASQSLSYPKENSMIEWRLADGKPFAVIMKVSEYEKENGAIAYPTKITDKRILIKGLPGFERIDHEIKDEKYADLKARDITYNDYFDITAQVKQIEIPKGQIRISVEDVLAKGDEKMKFVIKGKNRHRMTVRIETLGYDGEEGPVMIGVVKSPNGDSDGQPGGTVFDAVVTDGDYEITVAQNMAKSGAVNVRFKLAVRMEPLYE